MPGLARYHDEDRHPTRSNRVTAPLQPPSARLLRRRERAAFVSLARCSGGSPFLSAICRQMLAISVRISNTNRSMLQPGRKTPSSEGQRITSTTRWSAGALRTCSDITDR